MAQRLTHKEFLDRLEKEQPEIFKSVEVIEEYVNSKTPILVKDKYGKCLSSPAHLLLGCKPNIKGAVDRTEYFIAQAKEIHEELYNYSEVNYISNRVKIKITSEHGTFWQTPNDHLSGAGCPILSRERTTKAARENPTGWSHDNWEQAGVKSKTFDSFKVYILKCWENGETFYKVGKTYKTIEKRFRGKTKMPYNYEVIKIIKGAAKEVSDLEHSLHRAYKSFKYSPLKKFNGSHECFSQITNVKC